LTHLSKRDCKIKEQIQSFIKENDIQSAGDIQNALKKRFASTVQEFMEAELDTHLGYAKHDAKNLLLLCPYHYYGFDEFANRGR